MTGGGERADASKATPRPGIVELLESVCGYLEGAAEFPQYGFFSGGDPRDFTPDHDSCSPEEIANHKAAVEAVERNKVPLGNLSEWLESDDGKNVMHLLRAPFGIGTCVYRDKHATRALRRARAALALARGDAT